jgi:hypothetical protein
LTPYFAYFEGMRKEVTSQKILKRENSGKEKMKKESEEQVEVEIFQPLQETTGRHYIDWKYII